MIENDDTRSTCTGHSTRDKVRSLGRETKAKTKKLLRKSYASPEEEAAEDGVHNPYAKIQHDSAFDPAQSFNQNGKSLGDTPSRVAGNLSGGFKAILHPRSAVKKKAASKVAVKNEPYVSREADLEFLEAHDNLSRAKSSNDHGSENKEYIEGQQDRVDTLESLRQSRKVAWTTSRHVQRVLVCPKREFPAPRKEDFYVVDGDTGDRRLDWKSWLHARNMNSLKGFAFNRMGAVDFGGQTPFDYDVTTKYMERILIASSPWQSWFLSLRRLYRWEDPAETKKWFAIWFFIWYLDYIMSFILAYIAYKVLRNKFGHKQIQSMRQSYERSLDDNAAAFRFNEIIHQHGTDKWLGPVADTVGPILQMQLSDLADTLEVLNNFYEWRSPKHTWATLFWLFCAVLIGALTPKDYTWKIVYLYVILSFFIARPVASLHPEYRHVVNAFRWLFWNIPTDAEWAMMYLREKAQETRADLISQKIQDAHDGDISHPRAYTGSLILPTITRTMSVESSISSSESDSNDTDSFRTVDSTTSVLGGLDIISFRCSMHGISGRLVIFSDGLKFERNSRVASLRKEEWRYLWSELVEMRKVNTSNLPKVFTEEGLQLSFLDGKEIRLVHVRRRDRAFNCILGFSALRFQIVPSSADEETKDRALGTDNEAFHEAEGF